MAIAVLVLVGGLDTVSIAVVGLVRPGIPLASRRHAQPISRKLLLNHRTFMATFYGLRQEGMRGSLTRVGLVLLQVSTEDAHVEAVPTLLNLNSGWDLPLYNIAWSSRSFSAQDHISSEEGTYQRSLHIFPMVISRPASPHINSRGIDTGRYPVKRSVMNVYKLGYIQTSILLSCAVSAKSYHKIIAVFAVF